MIRALGDLDLAEGGLHEAFAAALSSPSARGVPKNLRARLIATAMYKADDGIRRERRGRELLEQPVERENHEPTDHVDDDQLRRVFTCCLPSLRNAD